MKTKKNPNKQKGNCVEEPHAAYGIDMNALKLAGINALLSINNPSTLEKAVKSLFKTADFHWSEPDVEEEYISKEEILAGIREGLEEMKERKYTGRKAITLQELIDEL